MLTDLELSRFDAIVVSSEVGYEKPSPEIFKIALGKEKVEFGMLKIMEIFCRMKKCSYFLFSRSNRCGRRQGSACRR